MVGFEKNGEPKMISWVWLKIFLINIFCSVFLVVYAVDLGCSDAAVGLKKMESSQEGVSQAEAEIELNKKIDEKYKKFCENSKKGETVNLGKLCFKEKFSLDLEILREVELENGLFCEVNMLKAKSLASNNVNGWWCYNIVGTSNGCEHAGPGGRACNINP